MTQEELNYNFAKIQQHIQALGSYIIQVQIQQPQAIEALNTLITSIENLESFQQQMQANLAEIEFLEAELLQQNETIIAERQVYHDLFKFAPNAYLVTNAEGIILETNYTAAALLNVLPSLLIGKSLINFVAQDEHSLLLARLKESLNIESVQELEVTICCRGNQAFDALLLVKPGRETAGALGALQISLHDITKYKRLPIPEELPSWGASVAKLKGLDGLRILFVDDEIDIRELITAVLMQHGV